MTYRQRQCLACWATLVLLAAALALPAPAGEEKVFKLTFKDGSVQEAGALAETDAKDKVRKQPCKVYVIDLKGGHTYRIDMTKKEGKNNKDIDPFLRLEDSSGKELLADDDSGGFPNARIVFPCPQDGTYRIVATAFGAATGPFELTVKQAAAVKATALAFKDGEVKVEAELTGTDPKDIIRQSSMCKVYAIKLVKGKSYQIDMMSKQVDCFLRLEDPRGQQADQDDDSGGAFDARISFNCMEDGVYRIVATTYLGGTGPFTLTVKEK
jgi:hypothetical protein